MSKESEFFDDDGNIISTAWGEKQKEYDAQRDAELAQQQHRDDLSDAQRRIAIDHENAKIKRSQDERAKKRQQQEEFMSMPQWVRSIPRTPLTAPPTEGTKEQAMYTMSGKVTLTEHEKNRRIKNMKSSNMAIKDYKRLTIPLSPRMHYASTVSLDDSSYSTTIARAMSEVMTQSRGDEHTTYVVDVRGQQHDLSLWYQSSNMRTVFARNILNLAHSGKLSSYTPDELFPAEGKKQSYLPNHIDSYSRLQYSPDDLITLYDWMDNQSGVTLFDADMDNTDVLAPVCLISDTIVLTGALTRDFGQKVQKFVDYISSTIPDDAQSIFSRIILVGVLAEKDKPNIQQVKKAHDFIQKIAHKYGFSTEMSTAIPLLGSLNTRPLTMERVPFAVAHAVRKLTADVLEKIQSA